MASADDDHAHAEREDTGSGRKKRRDGRLSRRPEATESAQSALGVNPEALAWARSFLDAREADGEAVSRLDVRRAAAEAGIGAPDARRALASLGVRLKRNHVERPTNTAQQDDRSEPLASGASRTQRVSKQAPSGKVRIIAVDLDSDGEPTDARQPMTIVVRIGCDEPGELDARVLVRGAGHGEVEAIAPTREVKEPGELTLSFEIPADALSEVKHSVDVEAWLNTATDTYAGMHASARRFRSRQRGGFRPFVHLDARWSEDSV